MGGRAEDAERVLATGTRQGETARFVVTHWRFPPGAHTGWHRHEHDYVVVPVTTGDLAIWDGTEEARASLEAGISYHRGAGVTHDVINPNDFEFVFVEIELVS